MTLAAALASAFACADAGGRFPDPPRASYAPARMTIVVDGPEEHVYGSRVKPAFFASGGVSPALGRFFLEPEYEPGERGLVVVVSHAYWMQRFQSDPAVIGRTVAVDGRRRTIVGVAAPRFEPEGSGSIWIPGDR